MDFITIALFVEELYFRDVVWELGCGLSDPTRRTAAAVFVGFFLTHNSLYSNRAACHLKINNLFKCVEDCSKVNNTLV